LPFDWDVAPIPVPHRGDRSIARSGSVGFAVAAGTEHPREAFDLVRWLAGPEGQQILVRSGLQIPNQRAAAQAESYLQRGLRPAHAEVFVAAVEASRPGPQTETVGSFWYDVFSTFAEPVFRGQRSAAAVFPAIAPRIDQALRAEASP
jgi:multiple sugar transport system substrate-binding protein